MGEKLSTYSLFKRMVLNNPDIHMLSQSETEKVQQLLLQMMDDIHAVCVENKLHYVITGGCALGAVRHRGFIPWDDDIDVCLPRKDYDRFRQYLMQRFPEKYYVQEIKACSAYDLNFMKVRLKGTSFCEFLDSEPDKSGVFIDVFSIENVAESFLGRYFQRLLTDGLQFICSCIRIRKKRKQLLVMAGDCQEARRAILVKSLLALPFSIIPFRRWLLWTDKALSIIKNENSAYLAIPAGVRHFKGELCPREWFFPERRVEFEGREYYTMAKVERYLEMAYGDYHRIPPENEREKHAVLTFRL